MLQPRKGVLGPDSDTATNVSQLGTFPGCPSRYLAQKVCANNQPRLHMQLPKAGASSTLLDEA